jgi:hypothetical protein
MRSAQVSSNASRSTAASAPAGESLDRQQTAALDVQHPLALAAVLEHEVAEEAGGRALGERRGGEAVEDVLAVRRPGERRRQALGNGRRPPDRVALDHHREQHQTAVAIGVLEPRPGGALPFVDRACEQGAGG